MATTNTRTDSDVTTMTFTEAKKQCRCVGTAHASGDALRAMYAELIVVTHPGLNQYSQERFYTYLQGCINDEATASCSRELMRNGWAAAEVL